MAGRESREKGRGRKRALRDPATGQLLVAAGEGLGGLAPARPWAWAPAWERRPAAIDLGLIALVVLWFYWPFLTPGIPLGDFSSDVMVAEANRPPSWWPLPVWNSKLMCGRPTVDFPSPFGLLVLPFAGLEPVLRMKAVLLLWHVLGGLAMYALLRATWAGGDAALFGGLVYPVMTSHVSRSAVHGHVHVVMFYALLPLLLLGFFRLRPHAWRPAALLALLLALSLMRDVQRTLLTLVVVAFALALILLGRTPAALRRRSPRPLRRWLWVGALLAAAFVVAVGIEAFELVNGFSGDPYVRGWAAGEQRTWSERWRLDNLYTLVDRDGSIGAAFGAWRPDFRVSVSRYLGLSLLALIAWGLLDRRGMHRRGWHFRFVLLLGAVALWLSAGDRPLGPDLWRRWRGVLGDARIDAGLRAAAVLALAAIVALGTAAVALHLRRRRGRATAALLLFAAGAALLLLTAPLPLARRALFFLRDFRNPDWFGVALLSFAAAYPAALSVAALLGRLGRHPARPAMLLLLVGVAYVDFLPYRGLLAEVQRSGDALAELRAVHEDLGRDPDDFRVLSAEYYSNLGDLGHVWHRKRLAWDFRSYTAPRRTAAYFDALHGLLLAGRIEDAATLAGLANVKYLVDEPGLEPDLEPSAELRTQVDRRRLRVFANPSYRDFVQAWPEAHVLIGPSADLGVALTARLARQGVALVHPDDASVARRLAVGRTVYVEEACRELAPEGALVLGRQRLIRLATRSFAHPPRLAWSRPRPERIQVESDAQEPFFLVVAESYHPWWQGRLDGKPHEVHPGSYAFLGAFVPAGRHRLELVFGRPASYWAWGAVSVCCLLGTLGFIGAAGRGAARRG